MFPNENPIQLLIERAGNQSVQFNFPMWKIHEGIVAVYRFVPYKDEPADERKHLRHVDAEVIPALGVATPFVSHETTQYGVRTVFPCGGNRIKSFHVFRVSDGGALK